MTAPPPPSLPPSPLSSPSPPSPPGAGGGLPPALRARVLGSVRARPSPTRAVVRRRALVVALAFSFALLAVCVQGVPLDRRPAGALAAGALWYALVFALTARALVWPRGRALWPARGVLRAVVGGTPAALALHAVASSALGPPAPPPGDPPAAALTCALASAVLGVVAFAGLVAAYRASDPATPGLSGAALGALAGAWVALSQQLQCPFGDPAHVLATHVLPVVALSFLGWVVGRLALDPLARGGAPRAPAPP